MIDNWQDIFDKCGIFQAGIIQTSEINFSTEVRKMCEVNTCRQYGKTWACPPAVGTVQVCRDRCNKFEKTLLFSSKYELEDSFDYDGMVNGMRDFKRVSKKLYNEVKPLLKEFLLLSNEGCINCEKCTYPDLPCRFPENMHGSIEGYGIFVSEVAKAANINYINGQNTVTYFGALFFND